MADLEDVRRISLTLPGTDHEHGSAVMIKGKYKGFAWTWNERINPKKPRVPNYEVLAIRTASVDERDGLIAADPEKFFTEPHYNGFPAVLVRLSKIGMDELEELLIDGWRSIAPKELVKEYDANPSRG